MKDYSFSVSFSQSKSGHKIPMVNGVYLHSVYDPIKEAESLVAEHEKNLEKENNVLILGLGYGYHINEIRSKLMLNFGTDYNIYVIEPNPNIVKFVKEDRMIFDGPIKIICKQTLDDIFSETNFVDFLMKKPTLISHSSSFNLYSEFFKEFMSFEKHDSFSTNINILKNMSLKNMLLSGNEESSFSSAIDNLIIKDKKESKDSFLIDIYKNILS